jgi:hypothetical protein
MTEVAAAPASPGPERMKIVLIDRNKNVIRLLHKDNQSPEYDLPANSDPRFKPGEYIDVLIQGGKIKTLAYPPGKDSPEQKQIQQPESKEITGDIGIITEKAVQIGNDFYKLNGVVLDGTIQKGRRVKAEVAGENLRSIKDLNIPPRIKEISKGFVVVTGTTEGEKKYTLVEKAAQFWTSFKAGDMINFACQGPDKIKNMWKVDENGERPIRNQTQNQQAVPIKTVTIGGTINLENYENIKIEISGPFNSIEDAKILQKEFREVAYLFRGDMVTKGMIDRYINRVCGPGGQ